MDIPTTTTTPGPEPPSTLFTIRPGPSIQSRIGLQNVHAYAIVGEGPWHEPPTVPATESTTESTTQSPTEQTVERMPNPMALQPVLVSVRLTTAPPEDRLIRAAREDGLDWSVDYRPVIAAIGKTVAGISDPVVRTRVGGWRERGGECGESGSAAAGTIIEERVRGKASTTTTATTSPSPSILPAYDSTFDLLRAVGQATLAETDRKCDHAWVKVELPALMLVAGGSVSVTLDTGFEAAGDSDSSSSSSGGGRNSNGGGVMVHLTDVRLRLLIGLNEQERKDRQTVVMCLEVWDAHHKLSKTPNLGDWAAHVVKVSKASIFVEEGREC